MCREVVETIRKCQPCQLHAPVDKAVRYPMIQASSSQSCKWAIDIDGPFSTGPGIGYATKWVKTKVPKIITRKQIRNFVLENTVCRCRIPNEVVSGKGAQIDGHPFRDWCNKLNVKQTFTSVACPQAKSQCEVTNRDTTFGIMTRLALCQKRLDGRITQRHLGTSCNVKRLRQRNAI
ncbi:uncharacterized protein [Rutidosis leptorrhynchoides]|uniref:uncharacterized protein n=1 Tax=Rutidosis leptorrhynchoides TaxID=125765 RepID=UPI003A98F537